MLFDNKSGYTIPSRGIFRISYSNWAYSAEYGGRAIGGYLINAGGDVAYGMTGQYVTAIERGESALIATTSGVSLDDSLWSSCGPLPHNHDFALWPFLPGFSYLGTLASDKILVKKSTDAIAYAKVTQAWSDDGVNGYCVANPCSRLGTYVYDGTGDLPLCSLTIRLPINGRGKDPNIQVGNIIAYRVLYSGDNNDGIVYMAAGDYLDDKIGTVKMWKLSEGAISQGWLSYTATTAIAHSHSTGGAIASFTGIIFIERYQ
jgi:hypothetical protein